jgi:hypothetical protein
MAASRDDIEGWLERAKSEDSAFMFVVCDQFDYDDYPVNVPKGVDVKVAYKESNNPSNMQKVMEVYDLSLDLALQLNETRAWHLPK